MFIEKYLFIILQVRVKLWRDYLIKVDHVLRTETSFIFVETSQDAHVLEKMEEEKYN